MEKEPDTQSFQQPFNKTPSEADKPRTPISAQSPNGEDHDEMHKDREDIGVEGDTISPAKPPVALGPNDTLDQSSTLVDTVTDKIRGESMSLPADNAPHNSDTANPEPSGNYSHSGSDGDSSDKEHSRKRKLSSRSSIANEVAVRQHPKRPKESDVPEREEDAEESSAPPSSAAAISKPGQVFGFGSFASAKSPFVSGQSSTHNSSANTPTKRDNGVKSPTPEVSKPTASDEQGSREASIGSIPSTLRRSQNPGFAAFASTSPSPRPSAAPPLPSGTVPVFPQRDSLAGPVRRSKSPVGKHQAFGQYSAGLSRFAAASSRKASQDELSTQQSNVDSQSVFNNQPEFEDILKSKGEELLNDQTEKPNIQAIEHNTGEEEDMTLFQTRAKLYTQDESFAYKERGTGLLKVNVRRSDGEGARIVMRAEGVLRLLLNMPLYPGLICELGPDPKFIKVAEITSRDRKLHAVKVGNAKVAQELYDHLMENTPSKLTPSEQV